MYLPVSFLRREERSILSVVVVVTIAIGIRGVVVVVEVGVLHEVGLFLILTRAGDHIVTGAGLDNAGHVTSTGVTSYTSN